MEICGLTLCPLPLLELPPLMSNLQRHLGSACHSLMTADVTPFPCPLHPTGLAVPVPAQDHSQALLLVKGQQGLDPCLYGSRALLLLWLVPELGSHSCCRLPCCSLAVALEAFPGCQECQFGLQCCCELCLCWQESEEGVQSYYELRFCC